MNLPFSSLAEFDAALLDEYTRFRHLLSDQSESAVQRRFAQYGIFPKLGWALIGVGETQALSAQDPGVLYATIAKFIKCAHHCWGPADEAGIHHGGYDFCTLVQPALYSALLGRTYLASAFHGGRPLSRNGYGAYLHAANLMVCLENEAWPFREQAVTKARAFTAAKSPSKIDKAFVGFFIGVLDRDRAAIAAALSECARGYLKSDWGRHKPWTKATFIQAMVTYAGFHVSGPVDAATHRALVSEDKLALWSAMSENLDGYARTPHRFAEPLGFLNDLDVS